MPRHQSGSRAAQWVGLALRQACEEYAESEGRFRRRFARPEWDTDGAVRAGATKDPKEPRREELAARGRASRFARERVPGEPDPLCRSHWLRASPLPVSSVSVAPSG